MDMALTWYFVSGLNELVPENLLAIFDENELEVSAYNRHPLFLACFLLCPQELDYCTFCYEME